jgi:hypothetical protein
LSLNPCFFLLLLRLIHWSYFIFRFIKLHFVVPCSHVRMYHYLNKILYFLKHVSVIFLKQIYCIILISVPSGLVPGLKLWSPKSRKNFGPGTWEHSLMFQTTQIICNKFICYLYYIYFFIILTYNIPMHRFFPKIFLSALLTKFVFFPNSDVQIINCVDRFLENGVFFK